MNENPIPSGPADLDYPARTLARLALSTAASETADLAADMVDTVSDSHATASEAEDVRLAYQLVGQAQQVLTRAVITAREHGASWTVIGEQHGDITRQSAQERYRDAVSTWDESLDRPWEHGDSGQGPSTKLPDGCTDPQASMRSLDSWCALRSPEPTRRLAEHVGITETMVSANLPAHTSATRMHSVLRHGRALLARDEVTDAEWTHHQALKDRVLDDAQDQGR